MRNGQPMTRKPPPPKVLPIYLQCHCQDQKFYGDTEGEIWCVIRCQMEDGKRYSWGERGRCLCPLCNCNCNAAFKFEAFSMAKVQGWLQLDRAESSGTIQINDSMVFF
mmetsp:Transcript_37663/g.87742  ORF Transcript_37663/g.87742 Transcript_37663/m.87742 type:complete len:108 (+) Transcript_37663:449-772(+)